MQKKVQIQASLSQIKSVKRNLTIDEILALDEDMKEEKERLQAQRHYEFELFRKTIDDMAFNFDEDFEQNVHAAYSKQKQYFEFVFYHDKKEELMNQSKNFNIRLILEYLEDRVDEEPGNAQNQFYLAHAFYFNTKKMDESLQYAIRAVELDPENLNHLVFLGSVYNKLHKF